MNPMSTCDLDLCVRVTDTAYDIILLHLDDKTGTKLIRIFWNQTNKHETGHNEPILGEVYDFLVASMVFARHCGSAWN